MFISFYFIYVKKNGEAWEPVGYKKKRLDFLKTKDEENDAWKKGLVRSFEEFCMGKAKKWRRRKN